ncbi:MAG: SDR family NAD(P)-dependent oxidoreductase [Acidobacteriota bacterium]
MVNRKAQPSQAQVMEEFQDLMEHFLNVQNELMLSYLQGQEKGSCLSSSKGASGSSSGFLRAPGLEADPVSSVTAPVRPEKASGPLNSPLAATPSPGRAALEPELPLDRDALTTLLLEIVSARTGYPVDLLELDQDLEAGLGIDSIKRVEILGSVLQSLPGSGEAGPDREQMEELSRLKTLQEIIDHLGGPDQLPLPELPETSETERPTQPSLEFQPNIVEAPVQRFMLRSVACPVAGDSAPLADGGVVVVTRDTLGVADEVARKLRQQGRGVVLLEVCDDPGQDSHPASAQEEEIYRADLRSAPEVEKGIGVIRQNHGPITALLHLLPLSPPPELEGIRLEEWGGRLCLETRSLFFLAKSVRRDLEESARRGGAALMAVTGMGGAFASDPTVTSGEFFPGQGALTGFLKCLHKEWSDIRIKAVDVDRQEEIAAIGDCVLKELSASDGQVEIGYRKGQRLRLESVISPFRSESELNITSDWVVLATGGARGITAETVLELARRYQPTLLLVGQSPLPSEEEEDTVSLTEPRQLKAALIERFKAQDLRVTPSQVEKSYNRLIKKREIRANLAAIEATGARVHYYSADVRDERAFGALIDEIYQSFGRIDGVIHGAGIIEDKLVKDKTPESFDRVFDTKVNSAFILSRRLRNESLRFLVFFSSVAGRYGNRGQSDYAAANEVLNKLAIYLDHRWSTRVVAINWGPWKRQGMVSSEVEREFARRGVTQIPPREGRQWLEEEIRLGSKPEAEVVIAGRFEEEETASERPRVAGVLLEGFHLATTADSVEVIQTLDPSQDRILDHHRLDGRPVVPAAEAMELMAEVAQLGWPDLAIVRLRDIRVQRGLILTDGAKTVRIGAHLQPQTGDDGSLQVRVEVTDTSPKRRPFYRATVELAEQLPQMPLYQERYGSALEPFPESAAQTYADYLFHGPTLQCIEDIEGINKEGIVARIATSSPHHCLAWRPAGQWLIDPVVIDSGFQLAIIWARILHDITPLPSYFKIYHRFGSLGQPELRCCLHSQADPEKLTMRTNLFFITPERRIVGAFEGAESTCSRALNRLAGAGKV